MRKVLKSFVALFVIATMLLSMACVSFAADVTASSGEIVLSTNGVEEFTFGGESYTGVAVTVRAEIPDDFFLGWNEGRIFYDSSAFNYVGAEILDYTDDWDDTYSWPLAPTPNAYPEENLVKTGLGAYDVYPYNSQDMMVLYFAVNGDVADYSEQTFEFTPGGELIAADTDEPTTMPTTLTGASVTFPEAAPEVYTITYVIDGVTVGTQEYEVGAAVTAIDAPAKEGFTFDGWVGVPATMPAENITVTGSYTEIPVVEPENTCGANAYWALEDGVLSITGTGAIKNYTSSDVAPWEESAAEITELNIAEGITAIGNRAFMKLAAVEEITIPSTVTKIGNYAFLNSAGIKTVNISGGAILGSNSFNGCSALTTVNYTGSVDQYKAAIAATGDSNLEFLRANATITDGDVVSKAGMSIYATWIFNGADNSLEIGNCPNVSARDMLNFKNEAAVPWAEYLDVITKVTVRDVALIGSRTMFSSASVKELDANSETIKRINSWAFFNATALESVKLPASIEALGTGAFYGNPLTSVVSAATKAQYDAIIFAKTNDAFKRTTVTLADAVQGFHSAASSAQTINWYLVGDTLTVTGTGNMAGKDSASAQPWYPYKDQIKNVVIEEGITQIGKYAFGDLTNVEEIVIPSTVTNVQAAAFIRMSGLKKVTLSPGIATLGTNSFKDCTALAEVNFLGKKAEYDTMTIGGGNDPFKKATLATDENTYLGKGVIGSTITWSLTDTGVLRVMGTGALPNYSSSNRPPWYELKSSITSVIVSEGITKIGNQAFAAATNLTTIDLPVSVTSIGTNVVLNTALTTVNYAGTAGQYAAITIGTGSGNNALRDATVNYAQ
ncbi:MAG: leucine-rich repeat protein [Clostridia bacterium]|nr:leucine-rich repeat protein [Clostridia bacterium]